MRLNSDIDSVAANVHAWIKAQKPGTIFFLQDVPVKGSYAAIRQIVLTLVKEKEIKRLAQGIYVYPKKDHLLGELMPTMDDIAKAIARRDKIQLQPTGALALNRLGLSTQVPLKHVYYTEGTPRTINVGRGAIVFKKRSSRRVAQKSTIGSLVIAAMEELGPAGITEEIKGRLKALMSKESKVILIEDSLTAPIWIRDIIKTILSE